MAVCSKCIHDILSYTNPKPQNVCLIFAWTANIFPYRQRSPPCWLMVIAADGNCRPPVNGLAMRRNISNVLCVIGALLFGSTLAPRRPIAFRNSAGTWSRVPGKQFGVLGRWRDRHTRPARWSDTLRIRPVRWRKWNRIRIDLAGLADPIGPWWSWIWIWWCKCYIWPVIIMNVLIYISNGMLTVHNSIKKVLVKTIFVN